MYVPEGITGQQIVDTVNATGYKATLKTSGVPQAKSRPHDSAEESAGPLDADEHVAQMHAGAVLGPRVQVTSLH